MYYVLKFILYFLYLFATHFNNKGQIIPIQKLETRCNKTSHIERQFFNLEKIKILATGWLKHLTKSSGYAMFLETHLEQIKFQVNILNIEL